ncbi:MAG: hypothetical protein E7263_08275 [Lachnospiraceae bacterium]|nr:hypothetical protein [Lachnospiraceae bacterium]
MNKQFNKNRVYFIVVCIAVFVLVSIILLCFLGDDEFCGTEESTGDYIVNGSPETVWDSQEHHENKSTDASNYATSEQVILDISQDEIEEDSSVREEDEIITTTTISITITTETTTATTRENITSQEINITDITTEHEHVFYDEITYIHHDEEGHYEKVCVQEGYEEVIYDSYDKYCYHCGAVMDDWTFDDVLNHSSIHGAYGTYQMIVDTIWHEPVYEDKWIIDKAAYDEEVIREICVQCGYER